MTVTVVTPSLPGRGDMLREAIDSVNGQLIMPAAHLIGIDHERAGTARAKPRLSSAATTEWVATLEDDDLLDPNHLTMLRGATENADIVYSWCRVTGREGWNPNRLFDPQSLLEGNYIPSTALIRRDLILDLNGWKDSRDVPHGWDDWDFWKRALDLGARFRCVPEVTWTYRFWGGNKTIHGEDGCY
mgnify:CR=1 FL=1